jgi:hypothetical protein
MAAGRPVGKRRRVGPGGPVKARRGATIRRGTHDVLSRDAEEWLFRCPEVLSEGSVRAGEEGASWFGSTMITVDLVALAQHWRGPLDAEARERLVAAMAGSVRVRLRAMRLACAEVARRLPDRRLGTAQVDTRVRVVGDQLYLDVDVEVPIDVTSAQGQR